MRHFAKRVLPFIAASLALAAAPSHAQVAGSYRAGVPGTPDAIELVVQSFDGGATLTLTQYDFSANLNCPSGVPRLENWSIGVWVPATAHVEDDKSYENFDSHLVGDFSADGSTFTGTVTFKLPVFVDLAQYPNKAEVCKSGTRHFVATLQPATQGASDARPPVLKAGQALRQAR